MKILIENALEIVTCRTQSEKYKSGPKQNDIGLLQDSSIYIEEGVIKYIGNETANLKPDSKIDAHGMIIMPGFIDSHTHLVFAGDRSAEFAMRNHGMNYEDIAKAGGGISNTVEAVRKSSKDELKQLAKERLKTSISFGVTTIEIKSGYGLNIENEIKILEVINELSEEEKLDIYATFLGAHAIPKDISREDYITLIITEMIPLISERGLAKFIDVFCEMGYFTAEESLKILTEGRNHNMIPKMHTNQFYSIDGIKTAVESNAISADHLEIMKEPDIDLLAGKDIIACLLPGVSYFLNIPYAPARKLIEKNIPVALATDFNPGSCMTQNIQMIMSLAAQNMNMSVEETINSVTINAAASLGISNLCGSIEEGKFADLLFFEMPSYTHLLYHFGVNHLKKVMKKGEVIAINN